MASKKRADSRRKARAAKAARIGTKKPSHSKLVQKADKLFSLIVRSVGRCEADDGRPCKGPLQCAHLFSRRYEGARWHPQNAVALCAGHHLFYTYRPEEWDDWRRKFLANAYEYVRGRALHGGKQDMNAVLIGLEIRQREIGEAA